MASPNKIKYNNEFNKLNYRRYNFYLRNTDTEAIAKLNSVPSKAEYVRQLILADIQKEKEANK